MPPTAKVERKPDDVDQRRAARYMARQILWRESVHKRQRECGRQLAPNADGVAVRVSTHDGVRTVGFGGLAVCGSCWSCPVCASKIAAHRNAEVRAAVAAAHDAGYGVLHLTLTMRHTRDQQLRSLWDAKSEAWKAARAGRDWLEQQNTWGLWMLREVRTGKNAGQIRLERRMPTLSVTEVTYGENGWHVHVHALVFIAHAVSETTAEVIGEQLFARWRGKLTSLGLDAPTEEHGYAIRPVVPGEADVFGDYFTKNQYSESTTAGATAAELTQGHAKKGRGTNRTPFQVLAGVYEQGDAEDLAVWQQWERGSHGRRQLTWSPGLRELLGLLEEVEDLDVAEQEAGGETEAVIEPASWHRVLRQLRQQRRSLHAELAAAGVVGLVQLHQWLQRHEVVYYVPERTGGTMIGGDDPSG